MRPLTHYMMHPEQVLRGLAAHGIIPMSDKIYLELLFKERMGYPLDLDNPRTFNEKLQWLKLYDRRPKYTMMVDKYAVKQYVADKIGSEHIIPTLGVWDRFDDIDFDKLPNQFVLKCTHDSGGLVICKDKSKLDMAAARRKITTSLKCNYYLAGREWPYKNVPRKILAEQYMEDESGFELKDYKVHCFNGVPKVILVCRNRFGKDGIMEDFYSTEWQHLDVKRPAIPNGQDLQKPEELDEMLELSRKLSKDIPFIRTDFYTIKGKLYFGELTLYPASGLKGFEPDSYDKILGDWTCIKIHGGGVILHKDNMYLRIACAEEPVQSAELLDYKFMCFNGKVRCSFVCSERFSNDGLKVTFFDRDWNVMPFERHYPKSEKPIPKPATYNQMVEFAEKLSVDIPFVRVDFYEINMKVYFGELTFYPGNGTEEFTPEEWDMTLGSWVILPKRD